MMRNQQGQTLIETLAAMFILVMGIAAAFGLATYALSTTNSMTNQIIGMGLAREGIEMVKNMRDTNWLNANLYPTNLTNIETATNGCYDFQNTTQYTGVCYKYWLNPLADPGLTGAASRTLYNIDPSANCANCILTYDGTAFALNNPTLATPNYQVYKQTGTTKLYTQFPGTSTSGDPSNFYRRIGLSKVGDAPLNVGNDDSMKALKVVVDVWWSQKGCPVATVPDNLPRTCTIRLETYLTNWKTY